MDFPTYMYHEEKGAELFKDEKSLKEAGQGWVDTPEKLKKKNAKAKSNTKKVDCPKKDK